ncbi:MAG TPA: carbon-phosphorus lyase complex subunit PhnI [Dehalococcoidia bacterium]|nr:carbon-phosphorus lyase complex subunit PhnI [Dehalococcoidia bacterium]
MGYTAVRGGLNAIEHAQALVEEMPVGSETPVQLDQVQKHLQLALGRVMSEGGLVDPELAALAIKQSEGDLIEAAFLMRAYRSTLPRLGYSHATHGGEMLVTRRVSSVFRDIPGGQILGLTRDYTQRLLNFGLAHDQAPPVMVQPSDEADLPEKYPLVIDFLREEGMMAPAPEAGSAREPFDVTRTPPSFPIPRSGWLQVLARGEAGAMLMLAYSSMRGYGGTGHGAIAELRSGELPVRISHPITGRPVTIGHVDACEVHYIAGGFASLQESEVPDYQLGYGLVAGRDERKAISMGIIDCSLRFATPGDTMPVANQEFVVSHVDSVESSGFVEHLKLPHYVTFQAGLQRSRRFRELVEASSRG